MSRFYFPAFLLITSFISLYFFIDKYPNMEDLSLFYFFGSKPVEVSTGGFQILWHLKYGVLTCIFIALSLLYYLIKFEAKSSGLYEVKDKIDGLKKDKIKANEMAESAQDKAREELANEMAEAQLLKEKYSDLIFSLECERENMKAELKKAELLCDKEIKKALSDAKKLKIESHNEASKKAHASSAMQRYKRKLDKLKEDRDVLISFVREHHPELISKN